MTTIVITPDTIVGDTLISDGGIACYSHKIMTQGYGPKGRDNTLVGGAGSWGMYLRFVRKMEVPIGTEDFLEVLRLSEAGVMTHWDSATQIEEEITEPFWVIGSGREFALGALQAGADPIEAVRIACKYDLNSGGDAFGYRLIDGKFHEIC